MTKKTIHILLVEDNPGDALLMRVFLEDNPEFDFNITHVICIKDALATLASSGFDIILLDMGLPDSEGLDGLKTLINHKLNTPILVITGLDDEKVGRKAVSLGAQSYLVKGNMNSKDIQQNIFFSIERNQYLTKLQLSEEALKKANNLLSDSNSAKDRLITIISHDLKGPLSSILGLIEYINNEYDSFSEDQKKMYLSGILTTAQNTYNLIENLLTWAQSQTNKIEYNPLPLLLKTSIQNSIAHLLLQAKNKGIAVENHIDDKLNVFADSNMMDTIVRNLVSNAIKFTESGGAISISTTDIENGKITIEIKDTGVGISKEDIEKIFDISEGYSTPGTNDEKGTGLGMIIIKDFVEKNQGEFSIKSKVGIGTSIFFTVPLAEKLMINN